jgi:drug/metabolite transporter (DMT)-like permease
MLRRYTNRWGGWGIDYLLLILMTMVGAVASFFLKKASDNIDIKSLIKNKYVYLGGFLYVCSAIINIFLLRTLPYSTVLPLTSITYIWTMILSYLYLSEKITLRKIFGIIVLFIGVFLVAK